MSQSSPVRGTAALMAKGWFLVALTMIILVAGNPQVCSKVQHIKAGVSGYLKR